MPIKIANAELEIMRILWREEQPVSFVEIIDELTDKKNWSKSTINTLILRLRNKGIISVPSHNTFAAEVTEQEYMRSEGQTFLNRLLNVNANNLMTALFHDGSLTRDDIDELRSMLEKELEKELEKGESKK